MIYKVYPALNDFENLTRLKVESSDFANSFDYKNIIVNKPWGYEYLWFQNDNVAIWFLYIKKGSSTSLHCHARKRTSLIVLDGIVKCTTLDDKYHMETLDGVVLEPCVFHASKAMSEEGAFIMEIETPPMKGDLVRMNDAYGRQNSGYENTSEYSNDLEAFEFFPFDENHAVWRFRNLEIKLCAEKPSMDSPASLAVPISGNVKAKSKIVIECGEAVHSDADIPFNSIQHTNYQFLIFNKIINK